MLATLLGFGHTLSMPVHKDYCLSIFVYYWAKNLSVLFEQSLPQRRFILANDVDLDLVSLPLSTR